ncbi:MAG: hypothetical protein GY720_13265 [bacterium]|nr:hypothetical protein [bacterium]
MRSRSRFLAAALAALALIGTVLASCGSDGSDPLFVADSVVGAADYEYFIPDGTWDRSNAGEAIEILPARLDVAVGETIRIVNHDSHGHFVGIFYVGPGETATQRFASAGEFVGQCTVHPSGELLLVVHE